MAKAVKKPRKKATNGYKMPEPLPQGEILTDVTNNKWKLGPFVGKGGFGEIYSAQDVPSKSSKKYPYVIKVEPHENGPLFVEMHFYMKKAKPADIEAFKKKHKLKTFGMPAYLGSGSHEFRTNKYRFIVMEKFGTDIEKLRQENGGSFPVPVVFQLAWQMTYVLEYIHEWGYVHADLKGANILMGINPENKNQAYLVDFGLATKCTEEIYKPNPKKANDGTIEYLSRDAHIGVITRRGDLEILGYNIIHWLGGKLPWESRLKDVKAVQEGKEQAMKDIPKFVKSCFGSTTIKSIDTIVKFLKYVDSCDFNEVPDYKKIRDLFKKEVESYGAKIDGPLEFQPMRKRRSIGDNVETPEKKSKENSRTGRRKKNEEEDEEAKDEEEATEVVIKKGRVARKKKEEDAEIKDEVVAKQGAVKKRKAPRKKKDEEAEEEEDDKNENMSTDSVEISKKKGKVTKKMEKNGDAVEVMTEAMKEVLAKRNKTIKNKKTQNLVNNDDFEGYNAEMIEVKMKKIKNEIKNKVNGISNDNVSTRLRSKK